MSADSLATAAARVDVIDLAGRIIADPRRAAVSMAGQLALAKHFEEVLAVALAAQELSHLHIRRMFILSGEAGDQGDDEYDEIETRMDALAAEIQHVMAVKRGDPNPLENENGKS